jgi:hypothetical protein
VVSSAGAKSPSASERREQRLDAWPSIASQGIADLGNHSVPD